MKNRHQKIYGLSIFCISPKSQVLVSILTVLIVQSIFLDGFIIYTKSYDVNFETVSLFSPSFLGLNRDSLFLDLGFISLLDCDVARQSVKATDL